MTCRKRRIEELRGGKPRGAGRGKRPPQSRSRMHAIERKLATGHSSPNPRSADRICLESPSNSGQPMRYKRDPGAIARPGLSVARNALRRNVCESALINSNQRQASAAAGKARTRIVKEASP